MLRNISLGFNGSSYFKGTPMGAFFYARTSGGLIACFPIGG